MMVVLIIVLLLVVGALVAVVAGRVGTDAMSGPGSTSSFELPDGPLGARGVDSVRFDQALRGYNMGQVDAVLDRLFDEIAQLEARVGDGSPRRGASLDDDAEIVPFRSRERRAGDLDGVLEGADDGATTAESRKPTTSGEAGATAVGSVDLEKGTSGRHARRTSSESERDNQGDEDA